MTLTKYGFVWPEKHFPYSDRLAACETKVERVASIQRSPHEGEHRILEIKTPKETLVVRITPTGLIRSHMEDRRGT